MREKKFRAWHPVINQHYFSDEYSNLADFFEQVYRFELDDVEIELMQYTGLKDKNGKEIYEGDIVKISMLGFWICESRLVEWNGKGYTYIGEDYHREVIGNIYENKELTNADNKL